MPFKDPDAAAAYWRRYHDRNRARRNAQARRRFHESPRTREYHRRYYREHRVENRAREHAATERWRRARPERELAWRLRIAIRKSLTGHPYPGALRLVGLTPEDVAHRLLPFLGGPCPECRVVVLTLRSAEIDHIVPLASAQTNDEVLQLNRLDNLRLICRRCNRSKGARPSLQTVPPP